MCAPEKKWCETCDVCVMGGGTYLLSNERRMAEHLIGLAHVVRPTWPRSSLTVCNLTRCLLLCSPWLSIAPRDVTDVIGVVLRSSVHYLSVVCENNSLRYSGRALAKHPQIGTRNKGCEDHFFRGNLFLIG